MFRSLRWRLTLWFVCLSTLVYVASTFLGMFLFHAALTQALDDELHAMSAGVRPAIIMVGSTPNLKSWATIARKKSFKVTATLELFDVRQRLLEEHGPKGLTVLSHLPVHEIEPIISGTRQRILVRTLRNGSEVVGYLQIQMSTKHRDQAIRQFGQTMAEIAPLLLFGLSVVGYLFSAKASAPIEASFALLRRFMADAGHELSTPIAIIQANAESIEAELKSGGVPLDRLQAIMSATERMGALVKDLMFLAKTEIPELMPQNMPVRLEELVTEASAEFAELFRGKGIEFDHQDVKTAQVTGNPDSLKRMLDNLLQNAWRYSNQGSQVSVSLRAQGRYAFLSVSDTGIGIPPESLPHIFDRFYRVDKSRSRAQGGSGLGLSIVKAIAESHGGRVSVSSQLRTGTTFTVVLPLSPASA